MESEEDNSTKEVKKAVLHPRLGGGPHGLGDPDDRFLRRVEKDVLIPKKVREVSRTEKCPSEVQDFFDCADDNKFVYVLRCKPQSDRMKECLARWFNDEQLVRRCTEEYLRERSEYRRTGLTQKERRASNLA